MIKFYLGEIDRKAALTLAQDVALQAVKLIGKITIMLMNFPDVVTLDIYL
jgi:hypothetical protein